MKKKCLLQQLKTEYRAFELFKYFFPYSHLFFLTLEFITLAVLHCVNLAKLELCFPEFPFMCSSGLGLAGREIRMRLGRLKWHLSPVLGVLVQGPRHPCSLCILLWPAESPCRCRGTASDTRSPASASPTTRPGTLELLYGEERQFFCRWLVSSFKSMQWETDVGSSSFSGVPLCPSRVRCLCSPEVSAALPWACPADLQRLQAAARLRQQAGFFTSFPSWPWVVTFLFFYASPSTLLFSQHNCVRSNPCR